MVTQTEEERGFTLPTYSADDVKRQKKNVQLMSNVRVRAHGLPALASMKKVAYWVKTESAWPDPRRVPLDAMKRDPYDSAYTKFRRMAQAVMVVGAGEKMAKRHIDEEAGLTPKNGTVWANPDCIVDLLEELEDYRDRISDHEMGEVTSLMHESLHKATTRGGESVSYACTRQITKVVVEYVAQQRTRPPPGQVTRPGRSPRKMKRPLGGVEGLKEPKKDRDSSKLQKAASPSPSGSPYKYPDTEGALGPNGLERKVGGNDAGTVCVRHAKGTCNFKTCSFAHKR